MRAKNGIHRAGLEAQGAADASVFMDECDSRGFPEVVGAGVLRRGSAQEVGQGVDERLSSWRTLIDVCPVSNQGLCIRFAAGITALSALSLWQKSLDFADQGGGIGSRSSRQAVDQEAQETEQADDERQSQEFHLRRAPRRRIPKRQGRQFRQ